MRNSKKGGWSCLQYWVAMAMLCLAAGHAGATASDQVMDGAAPDPDVLDLSRAWRLALDYDNVYKAAISEQAAASTESAQGRSGLLPHIQAGYHRSRVSGNIVQTDTLGRQADSSLSYNSFNAYVQLQQPILNYARYADYRRGKARAQMGTTVFVDKRQQTGVRLATVYFNALLAYDNLVLKRSLASSLQSQVLAVESRYRQHEATRIDLQETAARLAVARVDLIDAGAQWVVALRELEAMLGGVPTKLAVLRDEFLLPPLVPATLNEWLDKALAGNPEVQSARQAVRVADTEVEVATSRYMPTTDLVAVYGRAQSENLASLSQKTNTFSIGIQISIPLFSGGYNRANVARARSDKIRLQYELRATTERIAADVARQYAGVQGGADYIKALRTAEASAELGLRSAHKGFVVGVSSNLEVLKMQDQLYQTRHELALARLEYLLARLKLAAAAGELDAREFDHINDIYLGPVVSLQPGGEVGS